MAVRPFAFGARLRDGGRTVSVRKQTDTGQAYVLEDQREGAPRRTRVHDSLEEAVRDLAATWRKRLH